MKEFLENMISRLEEYKYSHLLEHNSEECLHCQENKDYWNCFNRNCLVCMCDRTISIVNELAEEYSAITPQNSENSWIPCEKEFPNVGVTVLCYYKRCDRYNNIISYYYELMHRNEDYQWISNFGVCCGEVIKWMPLPPVYKEGSE